jgi:chromatin assembly factor 1 subunit A
VRNAAASSTASTSGVKLQPQFVVPALPPHLNSNLPASQSPSSTYAISDQQQQAKRPRTAPKNPFPDAHIPFLKEKVANMGTSSLISLVEALHLDLKTHKVKKNAIEAKIREICVKDQRHIWSVKADVEVGMLLTVTDHS